MSETPATPLRSASSLASNKPAKVRPHPAEAIPQLATPAPRTALGKRLWELRHRIVASGAPLLDWNGVEGEVRERRGERDREAVD